MSFDPAFSMVTPDEARALRFAVTYALRQGIATDGLDVGPATNVSLVSVAEKLGVHVKDEWRSSSVGDALKGTEEEPSS